MSAAAQQVVSGKIVDDSNGVPIPDVSIFIANTKVGTTTNALGEYWIAVPIEGSFEMAVSHVGYQPMLHKVDTPKSFHLINVMLTGNVIEEVAVTARKTYTQRDVNFFWKKILGVKPSKKGLEVLNPEKVFFYKQGSTLRVSCKEPIEVVNHEAGYRIRYILDSFLHDYKSDVTLFFGNPHFEELTPQNDRQKNLWEKKRQKVYATSLTRFIRALYRQQVYEQGFFLTEWNYRHRAAFSLATILKTEENRVRVSIKSPLYLAFLPVPINPKKDKFDYFLLSGNESEPIVELLPQEILIYSDGSYSGTLEIKQTRGSIVGLSNTLPIEYENLE